MITRSRIAEAFILLVVLAIYGIVGEMDKQDEIRQQTYICDQIKAKAWPDVDKAPSWRCPKEIASK
jgi:hypothetical protein